jgi:hypothetical protein
VADIFRNIKEFKKTTDLLVSVKGESRGITYDGHILKNLPESMLNLWGQNYLKESHPFQTYETGVVPTESIILGEKETYVEIH